MVKGDSILEVNLPDFTEKVFKNNPFINEDRIYDTGDLAQWTSSSEIVLTGRADNQVKLRGLRIELQEISSCVESFPGVIGAYSKICKVGGVEVLGVYYSSERIIGESELIAHAATYLPDYMIPSFFMHVPFLPMTANGKIDEASLPIPVIEFSEDNIVLSSEAESILSIFKKILNNSSLTAYSDYFRNGGNSLNAMQCVMEIE